MNLEIKKDYLEFFAKIPIKDIKHEVAFTILNTLLFSIDIT